MKSRLVNAYVSVLLLSGCGVEPLGTVMPTERILNVERSEGAISFDIVMAFGGKEPLNAIRTYSYRVQDDKIYIYILSFPAPPNTAVFGDYTFTVKISPADTHAYTVIDGTSGQELTHIPAQAS